MTQYADRLRFERLKLKHVQEIKQNPNVDFGAQHKAEIQHYLQDVEDKRLEESLEDVYVTDHTPTPKKQTTLSKKEDREFFEY